MWKTITLQPPSFDKRAFNNKSAKALSQHLFSVFLSFNRLLFERQVEKARQVLQDVRDGKDFKRWLFQEFGWDADKDALTVELYGELHAEVQPDLASTCWHKSSPFSRLDVLSEGFMPSFLPLRKYCRKSPLVFEYSR